MHLERKITNNVFLAVGLYTLQQYIDVINNSIATFCGGASYIIYSYSSSNGNIIIFATDPYMFSIKDSNEDLFGLKDTHVTTGNAVPIKAVNFLSHNMLNVHLKQIKHNRNNFDGNKTDILAKLPAINDEFGVFMQYKADLSVSLP